MMKRKKQAQDKLILYTTIPHYRAQAERNLRIRYVAAAVTTTTFTGANLASMIGVIATSAIASMFVAPAFKLNRVRVWGMTGAVGTPVVVQLVWPAIAIAAVPTFSGPSITEEDTSASVDRYAFIECRPPRDSPIYKGWNGATSASNVMLVTAPAGAIMDLDFTFYVNDQTPPVAGPVLVGATLGQIYHKTIGTWSCETLNAI